MKAQRRSRAIAVPIINLGSNWGRVVNAKPLLLYPGWTPGTHCTGGWVGIGASVDR